MNNCDKVGNYIGDLYLMNDKNPISFSLLRNGVCYINENSIDFCSHAAEMENLEEEAKSHRKGYWMNYKEVEKVCYRISFIINSQKKLLLLVKWMY